MLYPRPTLPQIAARVKLDLVSAFETTSAFFRRSFERGLQYATAGFSHHLHGHIAWIGDQIDPRKADVDILEQVHGEPWGIVRNAAVATEITAGATGTNGTDIDAGSIVIRSDGAAYTVDTTVTISGGVATVSFTAVEAGSASNVDNGEELTFDSPIAGIDSIVTVASTTLTGSDQETPDVYLARILASRRSSPKGGATGDFVSWLLAVPGVTRAWEYPRQAGPGSVTCYVVNDELDPITVSTAKLEECAIYLDQPGRQPVTMDAPVLTPTLQPLNPTIKIAPNTTAVQDAVSAELEAYVFRVANPGGMTALYTEMNEAVSIAPGETDHLIVDPPANVVVPFGSMLSLGTITWDDL